MAFCFADKKNHHRTLSWQRTYPPLNLILAIASQILIPVHNKKSLFLQGGRMNCSSKECPVTCSSSEDSSECCKICTGELIFLLSVIDKNLYPSINNISSQSNPFCSLVISCYSCRDDAATFSSDTKDKYNKRCVLLN
jgi:hypothetical protein